ncbi:Addiction module antitoxin, RelB/DinJ family [Gammaproteobacteria bacterium]
MTTIHVNLDDSLFQRADSVLAQQGLSITEAVQQWLILIAAGEPLPFAPMRPNAKTLAAMREHEEDLPSFSSVDGLMGHLREDH